MNNRKTTPVLLEVMLHFYYSCSNHPRQDTPGIKDAIEVLLKEGLIVQVDDHDTTYYTSTEKGQFFVNHLLTIPFPVIQFVIPKEG